MAYILRYCYCTASSFRYHYHEWHRSSYIDFQNDQALVYTSLNLYARTVLAYDCILYTVQTFSFCRRRFSPADCSIAWKAWVVCGTWCDSWNHEQWSSVHLINIIECFHCIYCCLSWNSESLKQAKLDSPITTLSANALLYFDACQHCYRLACIWFTRDESSAAIP